jgi:hypothetical protein
MTITKAQEGAGVASTWHEQLKKVYDSEVSVLMLEVSWAPRFGSERSRQATVH